MKSYLKFQIPILLLLILLCMFYESSAQPRMRFKARRVLRRTAVTIFAAQKDLKQNRVFTGQFSKAVAHQRFAKRLFFRGMYARAIHHSRRARMLAFQVIKANKGVVAKEWEPDAEEQIHDTNSPTDKQLDDEITKEMPDAANLKDEDLVDSILQDVDVEDIAGDH